MRAEKGMERGQDPTLLSPNLLSPGTVGPSCTHYSTVTTPPPCTTSLFTTSPTRWARGLGGQVRGGGGGLLGAGG